MPRKGSKPPAPNLSSAIPADVSQALQDTHSRVTDLTAQVSQQKEDIKGKLSSSLKDMLSVSSFVNTQLRSTGSSPLSISGLQGQASQPQLAKVPVYSTLPGNIAPGTLVSMNGQIYVFGTSGATGTLGQWGALGGSGTLLDTHANRLAIYPASKYQLGTLFYETDRTVLYVNSSSVWTFAAGLYEAVFASRPAGLAAADTSFLFLATDTSTLYAWSGSAWLTIGGGSADPNGPALIFSQTPRDFTADIEEIRRQIASLDTPFNLGVLSGLFDPIGAAATAQAASIGTAMAVADTPHNYTDEIEEIRHALAVLDPPVSQGALVLLFDALGAAATAQAAAQSVAQILTDPGRDWSLQIEELRRYVATLDAPLPLPLAIGQGGTSGATALAARTNLAVAGLNDANVFTSLNSFQVVQVSGLQVGTATPSLPNIVGLGTSGIVNITPGTVTVDPRLFLGGSTSAGGAAGDGILDADTVLLRSSDGLVSYFQATKLGGISALAPINIPVTGTFGGWTTTWAPAVTPGTGITVSGYSVLTTQWVRVGPIVFFTMLVSLTVAGTGNSLLFSLPAGNPVVGGQSPCTAYIGLGGSNYVTSYSLCSPPSAAPTVGIVVSPVSGANFAPGFYGIFVEGFYRAA